MSKRTNKIHAVVSALLSGIGMSDSRVYCEANSVHIMPPKPNAEDLNTIYEQINGKTGDDTNCVLVNGGSPYGQIVVHHKDDALPSWLK